jgi:hypothetical protein
MAINFLPKQEVPETETTGLFNFYDFLKDSVDKVIDAFTQNEESWTRAYLLNSWQHYGLPYQEASYRKDGSGMVWLSGVVKDGTPGSTSVVIELPTTHRPACTLRFTVATDHASNNGTVDITKNGEVIINAGSTTLTSLDGIVFRVE